MAETRIESNTVEIENSAEKVFDYLSDFNNFKHMMPPQVTDWRSTGDECSFNISGMATIGMKIVGKTPHSFIDIRSNGKVPFDFELQVHIQPVSENKCSGKLIFIADLNPMMKMMAEKPLTRSEERRVGK